MPIIGWVTAYVDESLRLTGEGLYVLAAVVVPADRAAAARATLRAALRPGQRRLHWRKESVSARAEIAVLVAGLALPAFAVTSQVDHTRQERARRRCLVRMSWELAQRDVARLTLESRGHADAFDRRLLATHRLPWALDFDFARPDKECLLWLPDAVAGAVARALGDGDDSFLGTLRPTLTLVSLH